MPVIYEPGGRAKEYSPLALNLYSGCSHGCTYCYVPGILRMHRDEFVATVKPRKDIIKQVKREAPKFADDPRTILLSFTSDPYQPAEAEHKITRQAIEILGQHDCRISVLTKGAKLATRDFDIMAKYNVEFGVSMVFTDDADRIKYEPGASSIRDRHRALQRAHARDIHTWISIEPVIDAEAALQVISKTHTYVREYKIGKINHQPKLERAVNWPEFVERLMPMLVNHRKDYYIKDSLWDIAPSSVKRDYAQRCVWCLWKSK